MATLSCSSSLALFLAVMAYAAAGAFAATHVVGDNRQWTFPQSASTYTDWANRQTFAVGDTLVFNFPTGAHDVREVTRSNYDACNVQNPIASYTAGPATVNLTSVGTHYFICGVGTHCSQTGQKMTVTVSAAASTPAPPPTSGGPTTPPPPPPPGASANPPSTSVPSPPGPSSAGTPLSAAPSNGRGQAVVAAVALTASVAALIL